MGNPEKSGEYQAIMTAYDSLSKGNSVLKTEVSKKLKIMSPDSLSRTRDEVSNDLVDLNNKIRENGLNGDAATLALRTEVIEKWNNKIGVKILAGVGTMYTSREDNNGTADSNLKPGGFGGNRNNL